MAVREHTMDVKFYQLSNGMLFYWQGHVYRKLSSDVAEKRTTTDGQQIDKDHMHLAFTEDTEVMISRQDEKDLRFKDDRKSRS